MSLTFHLMANPKEASVSSFWTSIFSKTKTPLGCKEHQEHQENIIHRLGYTIQQPWCWVLLNHCFHLTMRLIHDMVYWNESTAKIFELTNVWYLCSNTNKHLYFKNEFTVSAKKHLWYSNTFLSNKLCI